MKIIKTSEGVEFEDFMQLTRGNALNLSEAHAEGVKVLQLNAWAVTEDVNGSGEVSRVLSMRDSNGTVYVTVSRPFVSEFLNLADICEAYGRTLDKVSIVDGLTNSGTAFMTCKWGD